MNEKTKKRLRLAANVVVIPTVFAGIIAGPWAVAHADAAELTRNKRTGLPETSKVVLAEVTPGVKTAGPYMPSVNAPAPLAISETQIKEKIVETIRYRENHHDTVSISADCSGQWGQTVTVEQVEDGETIQVDKWKVEGRGGDIGLHYQPLADKIAGVLGAAVRKDGGFGYPELTVSLPIEAVAAKADALHAVLPKCGPDGEARWKDDLDDYVHPETGKAYRDMTDAEKADLPIWGPGLH
ncbi:hypothetical protein nbrc107696_32870 [Gordonia spumicola]|uniref:Uncharacterized protein n=1 Tax=Gordonia spumicola TaxID=589161 RepID=A0A7I9VCH8_9ACTN|nr:hypothetical protein [Gordonia spumicola]GEE02841.1 hypothetical protein nbrc107696_32870 [Gordonia spumicola]